MAWLHKRLLKVASLLSCISLFFCAGCLHRTLLPLLTYTLEETSGYSLLVPSVTSQPDGANFQTSILTLSHDNQTRDPGFMQRCSINGSVFSLSPESTGASNRWLVRSLSVQGWANHDGNVDLHSEWNRFLVGLLTLERRSCFSPRQNFFALRRTIVEKIPVPATEAAFFAYSFGGTSFVDLAPGMQLKLERPYIQDATPSTKAIYKGSLEADYIVAASDNDGVALRLVKSKNKRAAASLHTDEKLIFDLPNRLSQKPMLRLFLQSIGDGKGSLPAILLGSTNIRDLQQATSSTGEHERIACPQNLPASVECIFFGTNTAANLLSSLRVNGKLQLPPFGTTMGYLLEAQPPHTPEQPLKTVSLKRPLVNGGYAEVKFPRTREAVQQIVLLPGDTLDWKP